MAWIRFNYTGKYWEEAVDETDPATLFTKLDVNAAAIVSGNLAVARMPTGGTWTLSSDLTISGAKVNVPAPTTDTEAATKKYVDDEVGGVDLSGLVPYTGASGNVTLGSYTFRAAAIGVGDAPSTAGIVLPNSVPSPTTNALYNDAGTLKFNGSAIGYTPSGTSGTITKFTGTNTLGDSIITESGTVVSITGSLDISAQPYCKIYKSASSTAFTHATDTLITFDSEDVDSGGFHSTSTNTGRLTIPTGLGGLYLVIARICIYEVTNWGSQYLGIRVKKTVSGPTTTTIAVDQRQLGTNATYAWFRASTIVALADGDYIEVYGYSDGPNPCTAICYGDNTIQNTCVEIYKVA